MVSTLKIELDGNLITGRIDGTSNFTVTYRRRSEEGNLSSSFSSELTFYDDGYDIIYNKLINNINGFNETVSVKIFDDCCGKAVFEGIIRGDSIDWCSDGCYVSANIIEEEAALNCVKSTLIWNDQNGFLGRNVPIVRYCVETRPDFLIQMLFFIGFFISFAVNAIFLPVIIILIIFDLLTGSNTADKARQFRDQVAEFYYQCGRFHPSAFVNEYIKNVCQKCGLTFNSSILNGDTKPYATWGNIYKNTVLVSAPVQKGRERFSNNYTLISKNLPNETLDTLMTGYLEPLFNAEYRIVGNILYFERKDFFQTNNSWIDYQQLLSNNKIHGNKVCWEWIDKDRPSYGDFRYTMDAIDYCGNEALGRWQDIVEWNPAPINKSQSGFKLVQPNIAAARFRQDYLSPISAYDRNYGGLEVLLALTAGSNPFNNYESAMLVAQHNFYTYKFLIFDTSDYYGQDGGRIQTNYSNSFVGTNNNGEVLSIPQYARYNYPFWYAEGVQGVSGAQNNLYSLFHYIDNPRLPGTEKFNFEFTFDFDCDSFNTFSFDKTVGGLNVNGQIKDGKINEIVVNFTNRTIKVTGIA